MSDGPRRLLTLSVLGGALHGTKVDVEPVDEVLIGSDPGSGLRIDLPGISPIHARLRVDTTEVVVRDTSSPSGVFINLDRVVGESPLREGDMIWLGPPQEPGSVLVQCRFGVAGEATEQEPPAEGVDDFLVADVEAAPAAPADDADFVVAGFDAEWPQVPPAPAPAAPTRAPATPAAPAAPPARAPTAAAAGPEEDDPFFIGDAPPPPRPPAVVEADEAFFVDEGPKATDSPDADEPRALADPEPVSFDADEFFLEPTGPAKVTRTSVPIPLPGLDLPPLDLVKPAAAAKAPAPAPAPSPARAASPAAAVRPVPAPRPEPAKARPAAPAAPVPSPRPAETVKPSDKARPVEPSAKPRPQAAAARRPDASQGTRSGPRPARPAPARRGGTSSSLPRYALLGLGGLALLGGLGFLGLRLLGTAAQVSSIEPTRARIGQTVVLTGTGFAAEPQANVVTFGDKPGTVVKAAADRLEVVVPEVVTVAGQDVRLSVRVRAGRAESRPVELAVFAGPTLHGISPDVAMPGEEVVLAGVGWKPGATVRFGAEVAEVLDVQDTSIRVRVPPIASGPGTSAPVVVSEKGGDSNPAPFFIGRVPLVLGVAPPAAQIGEVVAIRGRGFPRDPQRNAVLIGGVRALIVSAFDDELKAVVPRVPPGEETRPIEVRIAGSENIGQATLSVAAPSAIAEFRFVAEPFDAVYGKNHAVLATDLGPAFVLAAAGGKTAAERAVEAQRRLNDAATVLRATRGLTFEVRTPDTTPALALAGRPELVLEVMEEDAAAYGEDWTGLKGRGGTVTRTRLARWWEAVLRDLELMLVRNERPQFAAALAPEGKVLAELFQAGQKAGGSGVPLTLVTTAKPALRDALRLLAFRVPSTVSGPSSATSAAVAPAAVAAAPLRLEGPWIGSEDEADERRDLTAVFKNGSGTISYEGRVTLTVPFLSLEQPQKNSARFSLQFRGGLRYYNGRWDGQVLAGSVARDAAGKEPIATFTLRPR